MSNSPKDHFQTVARESEDPYASKMHHIVDCSENPLDLSVPVRAIMESVNWILDRIPPEQKLVIVMGELHDKASHSLMQEGLLRALSNHRRNNQNLKFSLGYELPTNFLDVAKDHLLIKKEVFIDELYPPTNIILQAAIDCPEIYQNGYAKQDLFKFCLERNLATIFNDIANVQLNVGEDLAFLVDQKDKKARTLVEKYYPDLLGKLILRAPTTLFDNSRVGLDLSNRCMAQGTKEILDRTGSKIHVQITGANHVFGGSSGAVYNESYTARCLEEGYAVLPVITGRKRHLIKNYLPKDSARQLKKPIIVTNLDEADEWDIITKDDYERYRQKIVQNSGGLFHLQY